MFAEYNDYTVHIKQCARYVLSAEDQARLLASYRATGDLEARQGYISAQLLWVAQVLFKHYRTSGYLMDLIQDANMQLLSLVETYDESKSKFRTYAEPIVLKQAETNRSRYSHAANVSTNALKLSKRLRDIRDRHLAEGMSYDKAVESATAYFVEHEREGNFALLDADDRAAAVDCVKSLIDLTNRDISLDAPLGDGDDETFTVLSGLADEESSPEDKVVLGEAKAMLKAAILQLTVKQRYVLVRAYGLYGHEPMRTVEIAEAMGVSRQRVNVILSDAIEKLRELMNKA